MSCAQHASVRETLKRVSSELTSLSLSADRLQHIIGDVLSETASAKDDALFSLQDLDRMKQTLSELAHFVTALSQATPAESCVDIRQAEKRLALRDLAARLTEKYPKDNRRKTDADSFADDCELF